MCHQLFLPYFLVTAIQSTLSVQWSPIERLADVQTWDRCVFRGLVLIILKLILEPFDYGKCPGFRVRFEH